MYSSLPFNAVEGAPAYNSDDFRAYYRGIIPTNGVILSAQYPNSMMVSVANSGTVAVAPGAVFINGAALVPDSPVQAVTIPVPPAAGGTRVDYIVARFDLDAREIALLRLQGDASGNPPARHPSDNDALADIVLASVSVTTAGVVSVTDTRGTLQNFATVLWKDGLFPLPVSMGGTYATSAAQARQNLGLAAADHPHDISVIQSGVLPVDRGGLGAALTAEGVLVKNGTAFSVVTPPAGEPRLFGRTGGAYGFFTVNQYTGDQMIAAWNKGEVDMLALSSFPGPGVRFCYLNLLSPPAYGIGGATAYGILEIVRTTFGSTDYNLYKATQLSTGNMYYYYNCKIDSNTVTSPMTGWTRVA